MDEFTKVDEDLYSQAQQQVLADGADVGRVDDNATEADTGDDQTFAQRVDAKYEEMLAARGGGAAAA